MVHQFKSFIGSAALCTVEWEGRSTLGPSSSAVYLQIYNRDNASWDTIDSITSGVADIDFELFETVRNLTPYKDASNVIACRVYQLANSATVEYELLTDYYDVLLPITYNDKYSEKNTQYQRKYKPNVAKKHSWY